MDTISRSKDKRGQWRKPMSKQSQTASYFAALMRECESKRSHGTVAWFDVDDALEFTAADYDVELAATEPYRRISHH